MTLVRLAIASFVFLTACSTTPHTPPVPAPGQLSVGFLIVDGVYNSELMAPYDIFQHTIFHTAPGMAVFTVAASRAPVRSFEGLYVVPDYTYADAPDVDVLVVPSAEGSMTSDLADEAMMGYVRRAGGQADWIMSLCDGAFVLAAAGLLDGKVSTTFPSDVPAYRDAFPHLEVLEGVSFVRHGRAITSAGGALSYDPALFLVEELWGDAVARGVAGGLVIDWDLATIDHVDRGP